MKYVITALATALIASFGFIYYQHFFIISELQSAILIITERPTYSSSVETTTNVEKAKGSVLNLEQANKANQENNLKNENKDSKKKK